MMKNFKKILKIFPSILIIAPLSSCSSYENLDVSNALNIGTIRGNAGIGLTKTNSYFLDDLYLRKTGVHFSSHGLVFSFSFSKSVSLIGDLSINNKGQVIGIPRNPGIIIGETIIFCTKFNGVTYRGETMPFDINIKEAIPTSLVFKNKWTSDILGHIHNPIVSTGDFSNSIYDDLGNHISSTELLFQLYDDTKKMPIDNDQLKGLTFNQFTGVISGTPTEAISLSSIVLKVSHNNGVTELTGESNPFNISISDDQSLPTSALKIQNNQLLGFDDNFTIDDLQNYNYVIIPNTVTILYPNPENPLVPNRFDYYDGCVIPCDDVTKKTVLVSDRVDAIFDSDRLRTDVKDELFPSRRQMHISVDLDADGFTYYEREVNHIIVLRGELADQHARNARTANQFQLCKTLSIISGIAMLLLTVIDVATIIWSNIIDSEVEEFISQI